MTTINCEPIVLRVEDLSVTFGQQHALDRATLEIRAGAIHALVGSNGSGKSTLVKVLAGYHLPDTHPAAKCTVSSVAVDLYQKPGKRLGGDFAFVHQDLALVESLSVLDNLRLGPQVGGIGGFRRIHWADERVRACGLLEQSGVGHIDPATLLRDLTQSERVLVAMARALGSSSNLSLLILDEATANVDARDVDIIHSVVRDVARRHGAVLYISHRLDEVLKICTDVTVLRDGIVVLNEQVSNLDKSGLVNAMVGPEGITELIGDTEVTSKQAEGSIAAQLGGLEVRHLKGGKCVDVSLRVPRGQIVGVAGLAGSGAEQLGGLVFGDREPTAGEVTVDGERVSPDPKASVASGMAYIPADRRGKASFQELTAGDNAALGNLTHYRRGPWLSKRLQEKGARDQLRTAHVQPPTPALIMRKLSGGNQQKLILSRWLKRDIKAMVLEQPTQGVDVETRVRLYAKFRDLASSGTAILVISADEDELSELCDRVYVVVDGRVSEAIEQEQLSPGAIVRACHGNVARSSYTAMPGIDEQTNRQ